MEFNPHVLRAGDFKKTERRLLVVHLGIGVVIGHQQVVFLGEGHDLFQESPRGRRGDRIVGIIQKEDLRLLARTASGNGLQGPGEIRALP